MGYNASTRAPRAGSKAPQVTVYLTYAVACDHAMIDRGLYLPQCWTEDPRLLERAGAPDDIEFATQPALATGVLTRALAAGVPVRWVAADEVDVADPSLRPELEYQQVGYVLAIGCNRRVPTRAGLLRADQVTAGLPRWAWQRLSAGTGAKGQRFYDWALSPFRLGLILQRRLPVRVVGVGRVGGSCRFGPGVVVGGASSTS